MRKLLSIEFKQSLVEKMLNRGTKSLASVAKENNVGQSTLKDWIKANRCGKLVKRMDGAKADYSPLEKLNHVAETWKLSETEPGAYCREKGLYGFELKNWKEKFMLDVNMGHYLFTHTYTRFVFLLISDR